MVDLTAAPLDRIDLLERFASLPGRLATAADVAGPTQPGEWTPAQIVRHLIAVERQVWQARLATLETDPEPRWSPQEPGLSPDFEGATLETVLAAFTDERARTVATITSFDEAGWARAGIHDVYGRLDIEGLLRVAIDHDDEHLTSVVATEP
jgi:hypothetical protein